jgi:pyridoxine/pyridoxamine 5'-phosphate oxidase
VIGIAVTESLDIIFDTVTTSRKYANMRANPRVALVVGWDAEQTVQYEGIAELLTGRERDVCKPEYSATWPSGRERERRPRAPALAALQRFQPVAAEDRRTDACVNLGVVAGTSDHEPHPLLLLLVFCTMFP